MCLDTTDTWTRWSNLFRLTKRIQQDSTLFPYFLICSDTVRKKSLIFKSDCFLKTSSIKFVVKPFELPFNNNNFKIIIIIKRFLSIMERKCFYH